jgi:hypothetical protein
VGHEPAGSVVPSEASEPHSGWVPLSRAPSSHEVGLPFRGSEYLTVEPSLGFGSPLPARGPSGCSRQIADPLFDQTDLPLLGFGLLSRV